MPALNWNAFAMLPGSAEKNFELLCRGVVRQNFGSYGVLRSLANQPGVELHLKLEKRCGVLGDPGRWWGWQCKWYDLPASGELGSTRRAKIEEGIRKTETHVPGVTDWVLWTRRTLTSGDQKWFKGISSRMTLHLWTGDEIDNFLVGQATILRSTYFGELVLTPELLLDRHVQSVAPIRPRWQPEVHHVHKAEHKLRRMLGESGSWDALHTLARDLCSQVEGVERAPTVPAPLAPLVAGVVEVASSSASGLERVADGIRDGDLDLLRDELSTRPRALRPEVATAPRRLRSGNHLASLHVTNAVAGCHDALQLLSDVEAAFSSRLVAVLAPAGSGKTHLAAQLTVGSDARPYGVLLHGRDLHANHTLDDVARRVSTAAHPIPSMEALLAAVDAAGQRARHRLPVVIDGLNESEDPRAWKPLLAALESTLARFPYVLFVCTLRPEFEVEALPPDTQRVEIQGYGDEVIDAIREHFRYYKIEAADVAIPLGLLRHPLTLRLFCEVTNPTREKAVGVDAMPGSLTALFDRYLDQVGERLSVLAPRTQRYFAQDVRRALGVVASALWENRARSLDIDELRRALGDERRPWDQSLVRALEHEGVLLRMPSDGNGAYVPVYDRLGGHIITTTLLSQRGEVGFESWIRDASTVTLLSDDSDQRHPLAGDILYSLVAQLPRRLHSKQLWQMVEEPLRSRALRFAAGLEAAYMDADTVEALLNLVHQGDPELLAKLREMRGATSHPLNADSLDRVLRTMGVAERDLRWTEWLRRRHQELLRDLEALEQRWRRHRMYPGDLLRARWVMWTLTSTVRRIRDQATRTLYWFGRSDPKGLFALTSNALEVNDAYVSERMLAASYGVVMGYQRADPNFAAYLRTFLLQLAKALVGSSATAPTTHYLARLYVQGIVVFATKFYDAVVPNSLRGGWSFAAPQPFEPIFKGDARADEVGRTLYMDFENYTLGGLFGDRRNYDMNHHGHQAAVAHVRGVVWSFGWRSAAFAAVEREIESSTSRDAGRGQRPRVERYGKKYGWIGFFTYAGILDAQRRLPDKGRRFSSVDIDPSFPEIPPVDGEATVPEAWLKPGVASHERWIGEDSTEVPPKLIIREMIGDHQGPWVAVHGFVKAADKVVGREAWAFLSALVVPTQSAPHVVASLNAGERPWVVERVPSDYYTFAGEIPWHPSFAAETLANAGMQHAYRADVRVGIGKVEVEALAHNYSWESHHSEMCQAGGAIVPSHYFSARFDLRSTPQSFDQFLPDGTRATITLSGVDGLDGNILYVRDNLLRQCIGDRTVVWFIFGERELHPYRPSPPQWLVDAHQQDANAWQRVLTDADLVPQKSRRTAKRKVSKRPATTKSKEPGAKKAVKKAAAKKGRPAGRSRRKA
ncbi:NACHT domain-containing protein [Myxococcus faecalis]|uniref:NACHT domain-containing protein n=1 Tax=Myxococcus faecalis TaxID=3115646 RepID=UPI003CFB9416